MPKIPTSQSEHVAKKVQWLLARPGVTPALLGIACGVRSQSVYDWRDYGRIAKKHIPVLAKLSHTTERWWLTPDAPIPPSGEWVSASGPDAEQSDQRGATVEPTAPRVPGAWHSVIAWETPDDLPDNEFALVSRMAVKLSAGNGRMVFEEEELPPLSFRADFLRSRNVTKRTNLVIVYAAGDSMIPTIADGDSVLCDRGQTTIIDGEIYAIDYAGDLRVKRLRKRIDGGVVIISDNSAKHPAETLSANEARNITILGRVLWRGGSV